MSSLPGQSGYIGGSNVSRLPASPTRFMAILLTCRCKAKIQVKDHLAGQVVKCPKCGENLMVPRQETDAAAEGEGSYELAPAPDLPERKPGCPACGAELSPGAVLCVACGYHLLLRRHLESPSAAPRPSPPPRQRAPAPQKPPLGGYRGGADISDEDALELLRSADHSPAPPMKTSGGISDTDALALLKSRACPKCGSAMSADGLCPICHADAISAPAKRHRAQQEEAKRQARKVKAADHPLGIYERRQEEKLAAYAPYVEFRRATVERLSRMWNEILAVKEGDESELHAVLSAWPQEFQRCVPQEDFSQVPNLHEDNARTLGRLTKAAKILAEVTAADLMPEVWQSRKVSARSRAVARVAMLCRLAKGLGNHPRWRKSLSVDLDTSAIGEDAIIYTHDMLHEAFAEEFSKSGIDSDGVGSFSAEGVQGVGRRLTIEVLKWEEALQMGSGTVFLNVEARICYQDDEPDPGEPPFEERTVKFERAFPKPNLAAPIQYTEAKRGWSEDVISQLPHAARMKRGDWGGIDIICPCCGHPGVITDQGATLLNCTRCGHDAITGQPEHVLHKARKVEEKFMIAAGLITLGLLPILGFWIFLLFARSFNLWAFAICHVLGAVGIAVGGWFLHTALGQNREVKAEQAQYGAKLRFPEAAAENQKKIEAATAP